MPPELTLIPASETNHASWPVVLAKDPTAMHDVAVWQEIAFKEPAWPSVGSGTSTPCEGTPFWKVTSSGTECCVPPTSVS